MEIFKIRNKEGLYWDGNNNGGSYYFSKKGKQWKTLGYCKSALKLAKSYRTKELPNHLEDCEIVKFELIEKEIIKIEKNEE